MPSINEHRPTDVVSAGLGSAGRGAASGPLYHTGGGGRLGRTWRAVCLFSTAALHRRRLHGMIAVAAAAAATPPYLHAPAATLPSPTHAPCTHARTGAGKWQIAQSQSPLLEPPPQPHWLAGSLRRRHSAHSHIHNLTHSLTQSLAVRRTDGGARWCGTESDFCCREVLSALQQS